MHKVLQLDRRDNVLIALTDLKRGETIEHDGGQFTLISEIPAQHKFLTEDLGADVNVRVYGVQVGKTSLPVRRGEMLSIANLRHETQPYPEKSAEYQWKEPSVSRWRIAPSWVTRKRMGRSARATTGWLYLPSRSAGGTLSP
jgi:altronate hydrolase